MLGCCYSQQKALPEPIDILVSSFRYNTSFNCFFTHVLSFKKSATNSTHLQTMGFEVFEQVALQS